MAEMTREQMAKSDHISDEELARDIASTEIEIDSCHKVRDAYAVLAVHDFTRREQKPMHQLKSERAGFDIVEGKELLAKLKVLQKWRADGRP